MVLLDRTISHIKDKSLKKIQEGLAKELLRLHRLSESQVANMLSTNDNQFNRYVKDMNLLKV